MQWWTDFWAWYGVKFQEDPSGWIGLYILIGGVIFASVFWKRIVAWVRGLRPAHEARMRRKYGAPVVVVERPHPKNTISVTVASIDPADAGSYTTQYGERLGGTITYQIKNLGRESAVDLRVDIDAPTLQAHTAMYWEHVPKGHAEHFTVHIPFDAPTDVTVFWIQGDDTFFRPLKLPLA